MEEKGLVVCDTNVLIEIFDRNNKGIADKVVAIGLERICISSITYSEIIFGSRDKSHQNKLAKNLLRFEIINIDPVIDGLHRNLIAKYALSHGLTIQDAMIAATCLKEDYPLYTLNRKDFGFINELTLIG
jgi:predicted nucleic acid-binding protein